MASLSAAMVLSRRFSLGSCGCAAVRVAAAKVLNPLPSSGERKIRDRSKPMFGIGLRRHQTVSRVLGTLVACSLLLVGAAHAGYEMGFLDEGHPSVAFLACVLGLAGVLVLGPVGLVVGAVGLFRERVLPGVERSLAHSVSFSLCAVAILVLILALLQLEWVPRHMR